MNNCFTKLNFSLSPDNPLFEDCKKFTYSTDSKGNSNIHDTNKKNSYTTHPQCKIELTYFENEPIMELISKFNLTPKVFKIMPNHCYSWHRDGYRKVGFNINLSSNTDYLVLFGHQIPNGIPVTDYKFFPVTTLEYDKNTLYLFNTQIPHMSVNYGTEDRYLLTLGCFLDSSLDNNFNDTSYEYYSNLVNYFKEHNLT